MMLRLITSRYIFLRRSLDGLLGLVLLFGALTISYDFFAPHPSLRQVHEIWIEPTDLYPGSTFTVHIKGSVGQLCPGEVRWSIISKSDNVVVLSSIVPTHDLIVTGTYHITNQRVIPKTIAPGEYYYQSTVYDTCSNRQTAITVAPRVYFRVLSP